MKNKRIMILVIMGLAVLSCEGPTGPRGPQGLQGEQGPAGQVGPAGSDGSFIHAGQGSPDESIGDTGDFYLDLTNGNLFGPKLAEGWGAPLNLQGSEGPEGSQGPQGPAGPQGPEGPAGEDGEDGQDGENGTDGEDGKDGKDGQDGEDGKDGKDGSQIYAGNGQPAGGLGNEGDYYLDIDNYDLYGPKTGNGWGNPIHLQGEPGTANVIYSEWMNINWNLVDNPSDKIMYIEESRVTGDFINSGTFLVYFQRSGPLSVVETLPYSRYRLRIAATISDIEDTGVEYKGILISAEEAPIPSDPVPDPLPIWVSEIKIRYVLIPGGVPAKMKKGFLEDYEALADYYGFDP